MLRELTSLSCNWIQLYKACITKEDGLKLVKVDTMGPHHDALILLRSGAVLFSKADVKGKGKGKDKGKGKSQEVSWAHDEASRIGEDPSLPNPSSIVYL